MGKTLTKSALIESICETYRQKNGAELPPEDIDLAVRTVINVMTGALADGERIEIRGFGSFSLHYRKAGLVVIQKQELQWAFRNVTYRFSSRAKSFDLE